MTGPLVSVRASSMASTTPAWSLAADPDGGPLGRRRRYGRLYRTASQPDLDQQRRFAAAARTVRQHDRALGLAFRFVCDARDLIEVHDSSLNNADTGP
jgi:hypothetical protein